MRHQPVRPPGESAQTESDILSFTTTQTNETVVAAVAGDLAACDVWFCGPDSWISPSHGVTVRLYARQAGARVLIGQASLKDVLHTDEAGVTSAWVFSARGIPCQGFEVTSQRASGGVHLEGGRFVLRALATASQPSVLGSTGLDGLRAVTVSNVVQVQPTSAVTVVQPQASALLATVSQPTPSALQATAVQGAPAAASNRWPVYLSDGAGPVGTTASPLHVGRIRDGAASFAAASGTIHLGTSVALKSVGYLWHPSSSPKRVEIRRIVVSYGAGAGTGPVVFRALRISGISGSPGGSTLVATAMDLADTTSLTLVSGATGAPTRPGASQADLFAIAAPGGAYGVFEWRAAEPGKALVLRASMNEGVEVLADVKGTLTTAMQASVSFEWVEV